MNFFSRSRRKKWCALLPIAFALLLALLFRHSIISTAGEIVLSKLVFKSGKVHFAYESGQWKWGNIQFSKVFIAKEGMHAEIDTLTLKYQIHFYPFAIDHELSLTEPKIQVTRKQGSGKNSKGLYHLIAHRLLKHPLVIKRGCVQISEEKDTPSIPFSCYVTDQKTAHATLGDEEIHINLSLKQEEILATIHLSQMSLPWIGSIYSFMHWKFDDGLLGGNIDLCLLKSDEIKHLYYELEVNKLSCRNEKWGVALRAEEFKLKEHFASPKEYDAQCKVVLFRKIWPYFLGDGKLHGGEITFAHWKLSDVEGDLNFDVQNHPIIDLKGKWLKGDKSYQFDFFGKGTIVNQWAWKVECDCQMGQPQMPDMRTYLSILSPGPQKYLFQADISNVNVDQIALGQDLLVLKFPEACHLSITDGLVSGKIHAFREDGSWQRIELEDILAKQVKWDWKDHLLSGTFDKLHGSIDVDLDLSNLLERSDWEIVIQNAEFDSGHAHRFTGLNLNLSIHDKYIHDSCLEGKFGEISGNIEFDGFFSNLDLKMHIDAKTENLFTLLGKKYTPDPLLLEDQDIDLTALISQIGPRWLIDGELEINHPSSEMDFLTFGCRIEEKIFLEERFSIEGFKNAFVSGWFQTKELSAFSCNLPLRLMGKGWEIDGTVDLDGRFDDKQLEFILHSHVATFKSSYFNAALDDGELFSEQDYKIFHYDFQTDYWRATIPLTQVWFQENLVGLEFDELDAMVLIDGMEIRMEKIEAFSKGVYFEGGLTLDCVSDDEVYLDLTTKAIGGTAENVQSFFRQFGAFSNIHFPLSGHISSGDQGLKLKVNLEGNELPDWQLLLSLEEGRYEITSDVKLDNLTFNLSWDSRGNHLDLTDMLGTLLLSGSGKIQDYRFNTKYLKFSPHHPWDFDIRIETPTYDVLRCIGSISKEVHDGGIDIVFNQDQLHFFGSKLDIKSCQFDRKWNLENMQLETSVQSYDLVNHIAFLNQCGMLSFKVSILEDLRTAMIDGAVALSFLYDDEGREIILEARSDHLQIGEVPIDQFHLHAVRHGDAWELKDFHANTLNATASIEKQSGIWNLSSLNIDFNHSFLKGSAGTYHKETEKFDLTLDEVSVELEELQPFLNQIEEGDFAYLQGLVKLDGKLSINCAKGIKKWKITSDLNFSSKALGKGKLIAETKKTFSIEYFPQDSVRVKNMDLRLLQESGPQLWANCVWDQIAYSFKENAWKGHDVTVLIPPEMVIYLGKTEMIPVLGYRNEKLLFGGYELKWENQVEAVFDFHVSPYFSINGTIKDGYYWVGEHAWYMKDFTFDYNNDQLTTHCKLNFREIPFDIESQVTFDPILTSQVIVREEIQSDADQCLLMRTSWNEHEGFYVQSLEGEVCGLDFDFHHHPQNTKTHEMVLSGQLKINAPSVAPLLSTEVQQVIKQVEIGAGYKISGDIIFSKEDVRNSYFKGFLKGRDFELMGSHMKTLQSNIYINSFQVALTEFKISDEAGIFTMNEIKFEQFDEDKWNVYMPDINLQDFRPSLLNKIGKYRGRMRPLVIRELNFRNIRGIVGDASSFTGRGELSFINTFKRNYNILDVPIEIIARLGLDPGIMIPIHGKLEYQIHDGKIHLTELRDSYSEGKRSHFFLSPSSISFIDFDGSIHINIKMKQHVLLKFTEPFTLSIHGNLSQPKFSLK